MEKFDDFFTRLQLKQLCVILLFQKFGQIKAKEATKSH